jgi:hypothetical protein
VENDMKKYVPLAVAWMLISAAASLAQMAQPDPFVGTWRLSVEKSTYPPGTCPKQMVIEMTKAGDGIHYRSETTCADGRSTHSEYTADYAGKQALVRGAVGLMLPVSLHRVDANTVVATYTRGFQVIASSRRVVSEDGRFMTITTTSPDTTGKSVTTVGVYDKAQ